MPFFGKLPLGGESTYVATGYNKWGMTNGVAAALAISSQILEGQTHWAEAITQRSATASGIATGVKDNLEIGVQMTKDWAGAELRSLPAQAPADGHGIVGRENGAPWPSPPWTAPRAKSPPCARTSEASSAGTTPSAPGTAPARLALRR